ncbi:MAG TPA: DUF2851 family protein, partial [Chryseolinea sp.]|nr:DUF2851 family protein [Chryseolinea sp.]
SIFSVHQSEYWTRHYTFFKIANEPVSFLGDSSISMIIINAVVPLLMAYGKSRDDQRYVDRAVFILQQAPGETNTIINQWKKLGVRSKSAFDSQALIELQNSYCVKKRCLDCTIGISLINPRRR